MMKYILIIILLMSAACAKLEVSSPDGTKASYSRHLFSQEIHGLKIHKDSNGTVEVELESQKSDAATLPAMTMQGKK